jgi:general stress protein CsbA
LVSELVDFVARIATVALTPIVIFYALAAMHSSAAKKSREYNGSFWIIIVAAVLLSAGELISVYAQIYGMPQVASVSAVVRLVVFLLLLWKLREKTKESVFEHLKKRRRSK